MADEIDPADAVRYAKSLEQIAARRGASGERQTQSDAADAALSTRYPSSRRGATSQSSTPPKAPEPDPMDPDLAKRYAKSIQEIEGKSGTPGAAGAASQPLELEAPEGFNAQSPVFGEFRQLAGELGLDKERAGKVLALYQRDLQEQEKAWTAQVAGWRAELARDPEITAGLEAGRQVAMAYGGKELVDALREVGDHPAVARAFIRIAAEMDRLRGQLRRRGILG